jgi:FkbM family methyltransferase
MTPTLKDRLFRVVHAAGYTVVPNWRVERHPQTAYLQKLFGLLSIDCVLDVGANVGQYRDFLRDEVGFGGQIVSFEPIPAHAESMRSRAARDPNWTIENCALGAAPGMATLNVMTSTTFSSFLQPKGSETHIFDISNDVRDRISVTVRTLDSILPAVKQRLGVTNVYLKLDTQGFDLEVVRGAADSIRSIRALQTEASLRPIYEGMPLFSTVLQALESQGFEPSGIFPNNEGHFPLLFEFDFHMINGDARLYARRRGRHVAEYEETRREHRIDSDEANL